MRVIVNNNNKLFFYIGMNIPFMFTKTYLISFEFAEEFYILLLKYVYCIKFENVY